VKLLKTFELDARKWNRDAAAYLDYRDFATTLQREFGFTSLADVDLFLSRWDEWPRRAAFADIPVDATQSLQAEPFHRPGTGAGGSETETSQAAGPQTSVGYLTHPKQVQHVEGQRVEKEERLMDEPDKPFEVERIKRAPETPQPPPASDEYTQIQGLIRHQLVDSPIWTAAGERAYVAAAGDNGLTIISGRSEQIVEWSALQRTYSTLLAQGSLSAGNLKEMLLDDAELANAIIGILGLVNHIEVTLPVGLRYHQPPPTGPIRLDDPLESPFAANAW
jgi:hypothetical protein